MRIASVADVKARFSEFIKASQKGPIVVTRNGRPVVVMIAIGEQEEDELERLLLAHSPRLRSVLETSRQQIRASGGIRHKRFWEDLEEDTAGTRP